MMERTERFIRGHWGKTILFTLMAAILYTSYGCMRFRQVAMAKPAFMTNQQIQAKLSHYDIYLHDGAAIYRMTDVQVIHQQDLSGRLEATTYEEPHDDWKRQERREWQQRHKFDIHIYTHGHLNLTASLQEGTGITQDRVTLTDAMIKEIQVTAYDGKKVLVVILIVIGATIGALLLLTLLIVGIVASSASASGTSDSDSGDSGSGDSSGS